jgi:protein-tyrosine phosphatase
MGDFFGAPVALTAGGVVAVALPIWALGFPLPRRSLVALGLFLFAVICGLVPTPLLTAFSTMMHKLRRTHDISQVATRRWNYDEVRPGLFLGRQPRTEADIEELQAKGVVAIVALNQEWELFVPSSQYAALQTPLLGRLQIPVPDYAAPSMEELEGAVAFIAQFMRLGGVYVHCNAGKGRSPVVVVAHLLVRTPAMRAGHVLNGAKWLVPARPFSPHLSRPAAPLFFRSRVLLFRFPHLVARRQQSVTRRTRAPQSVCGAYARSARRCPTDCSIGRSAHRRGACTSSGGSTSARAAAARAMRRASRAPLASKQATC